MTDVLLRLLGARVDDAVRVANVTVAFPGGISPGWLALWLGILTAVIWWMYRHSPVHVSTGRRFLLTFFRMLFLGLVLVLLLQPVLAFTVEGSIRRVLVMLFDGSASMQIKDPRLDAVDQKRAAIARDWADPSKGLSQPLDGRRAREVEQVARIEVVKSALRNERLDLLPRLDREFDLDAYTFGQGVAPVAARRDESAVTNAGPRKGPPGVAEFTWVDRLKADSPATAVGDALREVFNRKRGQPLAGVILVTDGANNSGSPPRETAALLRQEGVPLYVYGVGITSPRDLIVANLFAPETAFAKDEVTVTVRVRAQGMSGQNAELILKLGSETVATKSIAFQRDGEQVVPLKFTPPQPGEFELAASIVPRPDEAVKDNNFKSQRLRVIDARIKVLMVEQSPRWEYRYLQAMLLRDRRVELKCWLAEGGARIARGEASPYLEQFPARKDELFKFDLVVFGDIDPRFISGANLENLNEWVSRFGGALVVVAGKRFTPNAYRRTSLEKMLPVEFDAPALETAVEPVADKPVRLELTAAGRASPMLRLSDKDDENIALWKQLPPVYWVARVLRPKPAAEVLLVDPDPARESRFGRMPVIALQQYGLGTVVFVGTDNTWRWRKNVGDVFHTALWGQMAQRVSLPRLLGGSRRTQLSTDRKNYTTGDRVAIYARLYSAGFDPVQEPSVKGIHGLRDASGGKSEVTLRPVPEQPGLYRGEFVAGAPGAYHFFVEQDLNTPLEFDVAEPKFELGETAMNEPLLRDLASVTGGAFFREEDLHRLPDTIAAKTERVRSPLEVPLWSSPLYFLLMLAVVTAEWVLRKMSHLK
jgi:hypothetical protein